jgi:hypothetical protein
MINQQRVEKLIAGCSKRSQRRGARNSHMANSLWHIVGPIRYKPYAISQLAIERNEAYESFSAAC